MACLVAAPVAVPPFCNEGDAGADTTRSLECLTDAIHAAERGAKLIRDMLAFSQGKHLDPWRTDLNALVATICERNWQKPASEVVMDLSADLWPVDIDPVATEIALVNFLMNARDAMPEGGELGIGTANHRHDFGNRHALGTDLLSGRYVRLRVSDEGVGIPAAALDRIYDPSFTTKPVGKGTGLGLSMVRGFMRQSGGTVAARPNDPRGTAFDLYFPAARDDADAPSATNA